MIYRESTFDVSGAQVEISYREWIESQQLKKISGEYERLEPSQECVLQLEDLSFSYQGQGIRKKYINEEDYVLRHMNCKYTNRNFLRSQEKWSWKDDIKCG